MTLSDRLTRDLQPRDLQEYAKVTAKTSTRAVNATSRVSIDIPTSPPTPPEPARGGVVFLVAGQGEITAVPVGDVPAGKVTVGYQVSDDLGKTTRSTLTVNVTR